MASAIVPAAVTITSVIRMSAAGEQDVCVSVPSIATPLGSSGPQPTSVNELNVVNLNFATVIILPLRV